jgi:hypothetical protein
VAIHALGITKHDGPARRAPLFSLRAFEITH